MQDSFTSSRSKHRAAEEVLREAREKHSKYKNFVTNGTFKPSARRVGMSRIQYGDGDFAAGVLELQRFQTSEPRPEPLPEMDEPVQVCRTLSRTISRGAGTLRRAALAQDPSGTFPDDTDDTDEQLTPTAAYTDIDPSTTSTVARAPSRRFGSVFSSALISAVSPTGQADAAAAGQDVPSLQSQSSTASVQMQFRSPAASPMRRPPAASMTGLPAHWLDCGRSPKARAVPAATTADGSGSPLFDTEDGPGGASVGSGTGPRCFSHRSVGSSQPWMASSGSGRGAQGGSSTAPQLMLDLSSIDYSGGVVASPPSRGNLFGGRGSLRNMFAEAGQSMGNTPAARGDRNDNGGTGGGVRPTPPPPPLPAGVQSGFAAASPYPQTHGPSPLANSSFYRTVGPEDWQQRSGPVTLDEPESAPVMMLRVLPPRISSPVGSPLHASPMMAAAKAASSLSGSSVPHAPIGVPAGPTRKSFDATSESCSRGAALEGWSTRRRSARNLWQQQQQQQPHLAAGDACGPPQPDAVQPPAWPARAMRGEATDDGSGVGMSGGAGAGVGAGASAASRPATGISAVQAAAARRVAGPLMGSLAWREPLGSGLPTL